MEVILTEDVDRLGKRGDKMRVADGYARNFLIPRKLAAPATEANLRVFGEESKHRVVREKKALRAAEGVAEKLRNVSLTTQVQAGEEDKLYGSVTSADVAELLAKQGFEIDKRKVMLDEPIKALGVYNVPIRLAAGVEASVKLWVVKES
jgi:large subunit ribosomal protein L9